MNTNNLEKLVDFEDNRLTHDQSVMTAYNVSKGWTAYLEQYSDYTYVILTKEGTGGGDYRTAKKVLDVYRTKWEAEDVMKLLNDLTGEM